MSRVCPTQLRGCVPACVPQNLNMQVKRVRHTWDTLGHRVSDRCVPHHPQGGTHGTHPSPDQAKPRPATPSSPRRELPYTTRRDTRQTCLPVVQLTHDLQLRLPNLRKQIHSPQTGRPILHRRLPQQSTPPKQNQKNRSHENPPHQPRNNHQLHPRLPQQPLMPTHTARKPTTCTTCQTTIQPGQQITITADHNTYHPDCEKKATQNRRDKKNKTA